MHRITLVVTLLIIYLGAEFYIYRALVSVFKESFWPRVVLICQLTSVGLVFLGFYLLLNRQNFGINTFTNLVWGLMVTIFFTKLIFMAFPLLEDAYRAARFLMEKVVNMAYGGKETVNLVERRRVIGQIGLAIATVPFVGFLYGVAQGRYDFRVRRLTLHFYDLPQAFDGFKVLQLSDIHSGSFDNIDKVARGVDLINEQQADLILFTGDMVNSTADEVVPYIKLFSKISAPKGKFSTLGNHDYGHYASWMTAQEQHEDLEKLKRYHSQMGFQLLNNEHVRIERNQETICLAGVENWGKPPFPQFGDLNKAFKGVDKHEFTLLMSHDPSHWDEQILDFPRKIHLTFSGHTHGMQMGIEVPGLKWSPVKYRYPRWAGLYTVGEQNLYVNRGFGYIGFPGRVGIWPEITLIELKRA